MKVLAGQYKSKLIETINSPDTRPMMSKVRESIFNSLQFFIPEKNVLDLYAGSGSLGIEALSRGAKFVSFVEKSNECIKVLNKNLKEISNYKINNISVNSYIENSILKYDLIFYDPPFKLSTEKVTDEVNLIYKILENGGKLIVHRHSSSDKFEINKNLFKNKWCILIKNKKNKSLENKLIRFWKKLGSRILFMNEEEHDKIFAVTSHLPHLIAYNLIKTAQDFQKNNKKNIIKYSAGGLRDFSRIAASNEIMWRDVFFNNSKNMSKIIDLFIKNLKNFKMDINKKRNSLLIDKLKKSKKVRQQILLLKQDISKPDFGREN